MRKTHKTYKTYKKHKSKKYRLNKGGKYLRKTIRRKVSKNRNKLLTGGALIGQGNFGCVFRPEITRSENTASNKKVVSKVVLKNNAFSEYRHEYKILKKMKDIDPKGLFHSVLLDAFDLESKNVPNDFQKCSLTKPSYSVDEFFVFNIAFVGSRNLTYYLKNAFSVKGVDASTIKPIEPAILFSLLANIIVGIKKMIDANILHKTLDTDSVFFSEPLSLENPFCAKIIDYGDGEVRKYKGYSDKNQDYVSFFKSIIIVLSAILRRPQQQRDSINDKVISDLIQGFTVLLSMVEKNVSYNEIIKSYVTLLDKIFGKKYAEFVMREYKL
jgi:serine/threonine protein kinase